MKDQPFSWMGLLIALLYPVDALAYLDAGTGSMIIQGIIGALVTGLYFLKLYWHRLLKFLGLRRDPPAQATTQEKSKPPTDC